MNALAVNTTLNQDADLPRFSVVVTLVYMKMIRVVEPEQKVEFLFEYSVTWRDERLSWNISDYCGIEHIYLTASDVWIPEITIVDAHSSEDYRDDYKKFVWVNSTGHADFFVPTLTSAVCKIDVMNFPFDQQNCSIKLMTQSFSTYEYSITGALSHLLAGNDTAIDNMGNGEWKVMNVSAHSVFYETGDRFPFEQNSFLITMERNPSFYISMIILPSLVINVLSVLGVFLRSADSMGKLGMALTSIMSLTFILGILSTALPKTHGLPKIAVYVMVNLFVMVSALMVTLVLPHLRYCSSGVKTGVDVANGKKNKSDDGLLFKSVECGAFVLFEAANFINFIVLVA